MIQPSLFLNAFEVAASVPIARRADPETSKESAERITKSGKRGKQHQEVLALLKSHPGATSAELAQAGKMDRYTPSRRLPELEQAGLVSRGHSRLCRVNGTKAVTWYAK